MEPRPAAVAPIKSSAKSRLFICFLVALGFVQLLVMGLHWESADFKRFFMYVAIVAVTSLFHVNRTDRDGGFSMNLPFVLFIV